MTIDEAMSAAKERAADRPNRLTVDIEPSKVRIAILNHDPIRLTREEAQELFAELGRVLNELKD